MILIRHATNDDLPWLLEQLPALDRFFGSSRSLMPTLEYAEDLLRMLIAEHPVLIASTDNGPIGFLAGHLMSHPLNPERTVLNAILWWVMPQYRGSRAGYQLLRAFLALGKERADWVTMTVQPQTPIDPSGLTALGFQPTDVTYTYFKQAA